jgi:hypothetical protein
MREKVKQVLIKRVGEEVVEEDLARTVKCVMSFTVLPLKNLIRGP